MSSPVVNPVPLPYGDPLAKPKEPFDGRSLNDVLDYLKRFAQVFITEPWSTALDQTQQQLSTAPVIINQISDSDLSAAVTTADLVGGSQSGGLYEVRAYQRIRTADGVSSSTQITIGWTEGGVVQSETFTALTGDTVTTKLTGAAKTFRSDPSTPITYATSYASNTPAKMHYVLDLTLARVAG